MTKIHLALPATLAAALALSACSKPEEAGNNLTVSDVVLNDESSATESNFAGGTDLLAENAIEADNAVTDNALTASDNGL